ncbi:hypothetical protein A2V71_03220 [Candidatus Berkelbacteria bacterium RBG_13_40_8]|uniref:DUF5671 domain-containing protein n=1 Tax=Candidatus Berkelbacteria bacterium RBG_13_40_8 TaxID=1797467 RepID=A0A1F5DP94_9BACT|nr:MAG: hypothetical protein A2V71_03220 [Candidatus Berkelbacteria bacterium RBG_13_40_8]
MLILLIIYLLFLFAYIAFNAYCIFRVSTMRITGDATGLSILIYVIVMAAIIFISLMFIGSLDWKTTFGGIF